MFSLMLPPPRPLSAFLLSFDTVANRIDRVAIAYQSDGDEGHEPESPMSSDRGFENYGDDSGDGCSQGNLAAQREQSPSCPCRKNSRHKKSLADERGSDGPFGDGAPTGSDAPHEDVIAGFQPRLRQRAPVHGGAAPREAPAHSLAPLTAGTICALTHSVLRIGSAARDAALGWRLGRLEPHTHSSRTLPHCD
jgi:hypothetical protein